MKNLFRHPKFQFHVADVMLADNVAECIGKVILLLDYWCILEVKNKEVLCGDS